MSEICIIPSPYTSGASDSFGYINSVSNFYKGVLRPLHVPSEKMFVPKKVWLNLSKCV